MSNTNENLTPAQIAAAEAAAVQMASMTATTTTSVETKKSYRPSWKVIVGALLGTAVVGGGVYFAVNKAKANRRAVQDNLDHQPAQTPQNPGMN